MNEHTVVLGAGIAGLSAAKKLSDHNIPVTLLEKEAFIGGMSSCFTYKDYTLDYGPHKIFTQMEPIMSEIKQLIGSDLLTVPKKSRIRLSGKYYSFPVSVKDLLIGMPITGVSCGISYVSTNLKNKITVPDDSSYESSIKTRFGNKTYNLVFGPYAKKVWGDPAKLSSDLAKTRVAIPSIGDLIRRFISGNKNKPVINADVFYYPKAGVAEISNKLAEYIKRNGNEILLNTVPVKIDTKNHEITFKTNNVVTKTQVYSNLVSTIPLEDFLPLLDPLPPKEVITATRALRYRNLILFYIVIAKKRLFEDSFIFYPEEKYVFNRISEQKGFCESMVPPNKTVLCVEVTCSEDDEIWKFDDNMIYTKIIDGLKEAQILSNELIEEYIVKRLTHAYPVYDVNYRKNLDIILKYLDTIEHVYPIGRQGIFNYCGMADAMDMGFEVSSYVIKNDSSAKWSDKRKKFNEYITVD
jgi:protoporphyrinogen oxidase